MKKIILFLLILAIASIVGCSKNNQNNKETSKSFVIQEEIKTFENKHLVIPDNIQEKIGFIPDSATEYKIDDSNKQQVSIGEEKIEYVMTTTQNGVFKLNFLIDSMRDSVEKRNFRLMIYHNKSFIEIQSPKGKNKYLDVTTPGNGTIEIPMKINVNDIKNYSELLLVVIDKDKRSYYINVLPATKVLVSRNNLDKYTEEKVSIDNKKIVVKEKDSKSNAIGPPLIKLLYKDYNEISFEKVNNVNSKYLLIDQTQENMIYEVMFFDIDGKIYSLDESEDLTYMLDQKYNKDIIIEIPDTTKKINKRLFVLINNNPNNLAFKNIKNLKDGKENIYSNFANFYEIN